MALSIKWHRLVVDGDTCERCGLTEEEVEDAAEKLGKVLVLLGVNVELDKKEISREKNLRRILRLLMLYLLMGIPLEELLDGDTGESERCDNCGDEDCRTIVVEGEEYEGVPSDLIVEAGFKAASRHITGFGCVQTGCCG